MIGFLLRFAFFAIAIAAGRGPGLVAAVAAHEICGLLWRVARAEEQARARERERSNRYWLGYVQGYSRASAEYELEALQRKRREAAAQ